MMAFRRKMKKNCISKESFANAVNANWGIHPKYGHGPFVQKVFPKIDRLSK